MKVIGLISGGKDSTYNLMLCLSHGHEIVGLANLFPKNVDELDSYMYQSVGHMGIETYAKAAELPLFRKEIAGSSLSIHSIAYSPLKGDEVEDLYELLSEIRKEIHFDAVSVGAILSDYQRVRVESVCDRMGIKCLAYLWNRNQNDLLEEMINSGIEAVIIKVASAGLYPKQHLGKPLESVFDYLKSLVNKYGVNMCGEGGEYETFTLDCPLFKKKIIIDEFEIIESPGDVGYMNFLSLKLSDKESCSSNDQR